MTITYICHVEYACKAGLPVEDSLIVEAANITDAISAACARIRKIGGRDINVTPVKAPEHVRAGFAAEIAARRAAE